MRAMTHSPACPGFRARHTRHFGIHHLKLVAVMVARPEDYSGHRHRAQPAHA